MTKSTAARYYGPAIILALLCAFSASAEPPPLTAQPVDDAALHDSGVATPAALPASVRRPQAGGVATESRALRTEAADECEPHWDIYAFPPARGIGPATNQRYILDAAVFDDGTGPSVFMAGHFLGVGGVRSPGIVKWDGRAWISIGWWENPFQWSRGSTSQLAVYDGALHANNGPDAPLGGSGEWISKWDGTSWTTVGAGWSTDPVSRMIVFDGGDGPELYAIAGLFQDPANQIVSRRIGRWNGSEWRPLGPQIAMSSSSTDKRMAVVHEPDGAKLYIAGTLGGVRNEDLVWIPSTSRIAKWDGTTWSAVGTGLFAGFVLQIAVLDHADGTHPMVYLSGELLRITEDSSVHPLVAWNGTEWSEVPVPANSYISRIAVFDDGQGPKLYAAGSIRITPEQCVAIARLEGEAWIPVLADVLDICQSIPFEALVPIEDADGSALYIFGRTTSGGSNIANLGPVRWDGQDVEIFGDGLVYNLVSGTRVTSIEFYDDGEGDALYASGSFVGTSHISARGIARWNGASWEPVGGEGARSAGIDSHLTRFDDGVEDALYFTGNLTFQGETRHVLKWDGVEWSDVGNAIRKRVYAAQVFNDGTGDALYVAGEFAIADGSVADYIARWDGVAWSGVVGTDPDGYAPSGLIRKLHVFDDGSGQEALYALGAFMSVTGSANLARWNGTTWEPVGPQPPPQINDIIGFDDGSGPMLYALRITSTGSVIGGTGQSVTLSRLEEAGWVEVAILTEGYFFGTGAHDPFSMAVFDDGSGPSLYISASFENAEGVPANSIVRWDGQNFSPLGRGFENMYYINCWGSAMKVHDDGSGPALFVGGTFTSAGGAGAGLIAKWQGCAPDLVPNCPGDINGDGFVNLDDFAILATNFGAGPGATPAQGDLNQDGFVDLDDFIILAAHFGANCTE
ncbi:MAG: hypothetical protein EA380_00265 [Phycisphaeraceae bacterium]|nr:MAG: hypothetical protein EA380_00265 [Phycisphaeraceae bacterium]